MWQRLLKEDPFVFLCNRYRQLGQCWLSVAAFYQARKVLESHALPLVEQSIAWDASRLKQPASDKNEALWRQLRLFIPWVLTSAVRWQSRLHEEPLVMSGDLLDYEDALRQAISASKHIPEGNQWTEHMTTALVEVMIQRFRLSTNPKAMQPYIEEALDLLDTLAPSATMHGEQEQVSLPKRVLMLPRIEAEWCYELFAGAYPDAPAHLAKLAALLQSVQASLDPSDRMFGAQTLWLMGTIATDFMQFNPQYFDRALDYLHQALDMLPELDVLQTIYARVIQHDINNLRTMST